MTKAEYINKRQTPRYQVCIPVREINGQMDWDGNILDISIMGAMIESSLPANINDQINLTFVSPLDDQEIIQLIGSVRWVSHYQGPDKTSYHFGIIFAEENWEAERLGQSIFF